MILAAGRGERMRPLTDHTPKPLLKIAGKSLIEHHLIRLQKSGFEKIVINHSWLGEQIVDTIGNGERFGLSVRYSQEAEPLETAGGIVKSLPILRESLAGDSCFVAVNGDIFCDIDFATLPNQLDNCLGHLVLVNNPVHNPKGDFSLIGGKVMASLENCLTYCGVAVYHLDMFKAVESGKAGLRPLFDDLIAKGLMSGSHHSGMWFDIGTPERLTELNQKIKIGIH